MKDVVCGLYNICTTHVASDKDRDSWPPVISILVFWQLIPVTIDYNTITIDRCYNLHFGFLELLLQISGHCCYNDGANQPLGCHHLLDG